MTTLEIVKLAAQIQVGSRLKGYGNQVMIVTRITEKRIYGYSEYVFKKWGKKEESMSLEYSTLLNPHYNKGIKVLS